MIEWWMIVLAIMGYKFLVNWWRRLKMGSYIDDFMSYMKNPEDAELATRMARNKESIRKLCHKANVGVETRIPVEQYVGVGLIRTQQVPPLPNLLSTDERVAYKNWELLNAAYGVYRSRMWETFSLAYWIELIVFFPRHVASYLQIPLNRVADWTLEIVWLVFQTFVIGSILDRYKPEITQWVMETLGL